ncbi:MAG: hypothetical protein A2402_02865 [Candidatus Staskawiczbacteria bacterium RIFOXYC1_FULL_37_43]|nr:MAG: hypothetical protein A2813_03360 [Candidatus Staskawiczbacteria bacterium RIFCSPHIGHO2_01_FULL_37_17]OGZ71539.1 MAG: hypothetical protein A2891_02450 [Candidatus Staskawiczbacteria bacterium RIFCSPLOWO2_01_FULL_37_19]OGZ76295.1 MAG: hypothetical protein A2205_00815 [Candidatus Staskawiczbacteria bacterium RIFOXYA1_FULL_37_15]OGZ76980.1 MAG: hypothetical protein A2280_01540 [Candidatus Staskawiczbacteria bacterium RIFOXYA12_FULL_37_10]OGZ80310.1 MAG: hypothetical protein A2353_03525 [Can
MKKIIYFLILFLFLTPVSAFGMEKIFYLSEKNEEISIPIIQKNAKKIDILAPQAYAVKSDLNLYGSLSKELKEVIADNNLKVMPLVVNSKFLQPIIHNLLLSGEAQDKIIASMVELAKENNYIGWQFDFEHINYKDKDLYSAFVEKTSKELHKNNLILSIAAVSRTSAYEDSDFYYNWGGAFDYKRISDAVDFISLMTYDDPKSYGPTSSVLYTKWVLNYVKDKISSEKLSMGIPFYYWGWNQKTLKRVSSGNYSLVKYTMDNFLCKYGFDRLLGAPWLSYSVWGASYKIWYENRKSFELKLNIVKQNNLRGFSAWVLGSEDSEIWDVL